MNTPTVLTLPSMRSLRDGHRTQLPYRLALATSLYVLTCWGSLLVQANTAMQTQIWPAAGLALALTMIWGARIAPAFFFGTLIVHFLIGDEVAPFLGAALGNTVEPVVGAYVCLRSGDFRLQLDRLSDILRLVLGAALFSTALGTLVGVPVIAWSGFHPVDATYWIKYWMGDSVGVLIMAPAVLVLCTKAPVEHFSPRGLTRKSFLLFAAATAVVAITHAVAANELAVLYLDFALVIWAAMRLGQQGATLTSFAVALIATLEASKGLGYFGSTVAPIRNDFELLFYVAIMQTTGLAVASVVLQRESERLAAAQASKLAEMANEAKTSFLLNVSHEVRTPLSVVLGFSEILAENRFLHDVERQKLVDGIRRNGTQVANLISDILEIAEADSEAELHPDAKRDRLTVADLMQDISAIAKEQNLGRSVTFDVEAKTVDPAYAFLTDKVRLKQILGIVIGNAFKFTPKGFVRVQVTRLPAAGSAAAKLAMDVEDSGIGIAKDKLGGLFKAFSQAESSTTRTYGGAGLGLMIARRLARSLGGDVMLLASNAAQGSRFRITLNAPQG